MSLNINLFGEEGSDAQRRAKDPKNAYLYETCWLNCRHCGKEAFANAGTYARSKFFFLCQHKRNEGIKCYESSAICERAWRIEPEKPIKPVAPGWEDY